MCENFIIFAIISIFSPKSDVNINIVAYRPFDGFCNLMVGLQERSWFRILFFNYLIDLKNVMLGTKCHQYLRCSFSDFKH